MKIPKIPWLEWEPLNLAEYFVNLKIESKHGEEFSDINLPDIFKERNGKIPTNILIEGPAGSGKSTLAAKLCFDHANGEEYIKHFDTVILLRLRELSSTLDELITTTLNLKRCKRQWVLDAIDENDDKVLFILDGYDELHHSKRSDVVSLFKKQQWPRSTIIVTSREASIPLVDEDLDSPFSNLLHCMHMRVVIRGLTGNNKILFLQSYLKHSPEKLKSILELVEKKFVFLRDGKLFDCPLFLLLLVIVAEDEKVDLKSVSTKTGLFKTLFNFLLKRMLAKQGEITPKSDFFDYDSDNPPAYVFLLSQFGSLALRKQRKHNQYLYTEEEVLSHCGSEDILKLGILHKNENKTGLTRKSWYEPTHLSLVEFSLAYHLWVSRKSGSDPATFLTAHEIAQNFHYISESLIFYFLCGLFGKEFGTFISLVGIGDENNYWLKKYIVDLSPQELANESHLQLSELADIFLPLIQNVYTVLPVWPRSTAFLKGILINAKKKGKLKYIIYDRGYCDETCIVNWHNIITHQNGYDRDGWIADSDSLATTEFTITLTTLTNQQVEGLKRWFDMKNVLEGVPFYGVRGHRSEFAVTLPKISQCIREEMVESVKLCSFKAKPLEQWKEFIQSAKDSKNLSNISVLTRNCEYLFVKSINTDGDISSFCGHSLTLRNGCIAYVFIQNDTLSEVHNLRYMSITSDVGESDESGFAQKLNCSFLEVLEIIFIDGSEYTFTGSQLISMISQYSSLKMIEFSECCSDEFVNDFLLELRNGNPTSGTLQLNTLSLYFSDYFVLRVSQNTLELMKNILQSRELRSFRLSGESVSIKQVYWKRLEVLKAFPESQGFVCKLRGGHEYDIIHNERENLFVSEWVERRSKTSFIEITVNES